MKTSSAKAKGRRHQQDIAERLASKYNLTYGVDMDFFSRGMGQSGVDIGMSPVARTVCPFDVECKNTEKAKVWEWISQAEENSSNDRKPLIVFKRNRSEVYAIIKFDDLLELL